MNTEECDRINEHNRNRTGTGAARPPAQQVELSLTDCLELPEWNVPVILNAT